jgi:flagellar M-ring protein FliF
VNGLLQTLRNLGVIRLSAVGISAAVMIAFFTVITTRLAAPGMGLLFSDLDLKDSGQIVDKLEALNVPYQLRGDGAQILVPQDQVARLRMQLAEQGLPHGGSVGYEIFDKSDSFGPSRFVENINQVRALEGELERTIASLAPIESARVHLVLPQRELFSRERQTPSASIVVKLRGAEQLGKNQVAAIQHLVASAVAGLSPTHVAVIDSSGRLLARGDGDTADSMSSTNTEEMRIDYENRMSRSVEELLERSVGMGKARVDVHADMDFDRITTNSESYDPDGQVVRSTQNVTQSDDGSTGSDQPVSVSTNLPNSQTAANGNNSSRNRSSRNEETVNYEITKTVRNQVSEAGSVKRLSVAVLVDGTTVTAADGTRSYQPRPPEELKQLTALVRTAIGYDEKRGDTVEVVNLPFTGVEEPPPPPQAWNIKGFNKDDLLRIGETLIMGIVAILIILLVIRPLITRALESMAASNANTAASDLGNLLAGGAGGGTLTAALPAPSPGGGVAGMPNMVASGASAADMIDIGQIEGRVTASNIKKVSEIVEKHPEEAVAIVRSWMYQNT